MKTHLVRVLVASLALLAANAPAAVLYVDVNSTSPVPPYADWSTAATNIQDAVDASTNGDLVLVTNGIYQTGGRVVYGSLTNRVAVTKPITVQSVNGPAATIIQGYQDANTINGDDAVRCAYLTNGVVLSGFTLTNGATRSNGDGMQEQMGGGAWCESTDAIITNCVVMANAANYDGGGAEQGTLKNCTLTGNSAFQGGGAYYSSLTNCSLTANSAYYSGGADSCTLNNTTLTGNSASYGGGAGNSTLNNCVLANNQAELNGGGVESCTLNNCTLTGNSALNGGGADSSTLNNCALAGNMVLYNGGAAENCTMNNCTVVFNSATITGGGTDSSTLNNCIVYFNSAPVGADCSGGTLNFCCTASLPGSGTDNITADPQLTDTAHISASSPCIGTGSANYSTGADIDGEPWLNPPSIGCDEYYAGTTSGLLSVAIQTDYTNVAPGFVAKFAGLIYGHAANSFWDFGDGTIVSNQLSVSHSWTATGIYPVALTAYNDSNPGGISATVMVCVTTQQVYYVDAGSTNPVVPFLTWSTAATNIQDAVDAAVPGGTVLVSNGVYQTGGRVVYGSPTNRVVIRKPITVQSVNGPLVTVIKGHADTNTIDGNDAVRCVYLTSGVTLAGFTLTNGATLIDQFESLDNHFYSGGGAYCESVTSVISNCVITGCSASDTGGGADGGTLNNCVLTNCSSFVGGGAGDNTLNNCVLADDSAGYGGGIYNSTANSCLFVKNFANNSGNTGGGAYYSTLTNCSFTANSAEYSGGADSCTLNDCTLTGNSASYGGGAGSSTLNNCALTGNSASQNGGGAESCALNNCTLTGNSAVNGGGADNSTLNNCIVYYNTAPGGDNYSSSTLNYCCTTPLPDSGANNITAEPQLTDTAHISASSPCIGAGSTNYSTGVDIDGESWLNPPSIGCDEFHAGATGGLSINIQANYTNVTPGFVLNFNGLIYGHAADSFWDFGDGTVVSNQLSVSHGWAAVGDYPVAFVAFNNSNPGGVSATVTIHVVTQPILYVSLASANPLSPYLSWDTAATSIQDAIDVSATAGALVLVSNGVYNVGGRVVYGSMTNRVAVNKPIIVRSVNGPAFTAIEGFMTNDVSAIRCIYLTNNTMLIGFALTNGATIQGNDYVHEWTGAGAWCESSSAIVSNCVFVNNTAQGDAGGVYGGTMVNCTFTNNYGYDGGAAISSSLENCTLLNNRGYIGGGACNSSLTGCTLTGNFTYIDSDYTANGGGASGCTLTDCVISGNSSLTGAGASGSTLVNCALTGNSTERGDGVWPQDGGGANGSILVNCTVIGNSAINTGGGVNSCTLTNCIVYFNTAPYGTNYSDDSSLFYCDTTPLPANGSNNIAADPLLADWEHISSTSPCRGAGTSAAVTGVDIDGDAWLNPPSIGCDEFYSGSATGALAVAISETFTNVATGFIVDFAGQISGHATANRWDLGDGTVVSNQLSISHSWAAAGNYTVTFTVFNTDNPAGVSVSVTIFVLQNPLHYVSLANANPVPPYLSWATAATNIQDAVDAAFVGGTIFVSNGVYQTGMRVLYGTMTNRVAVTKPLTLQSVNGAAGTVIDGGFAVRCLYLTNSVSVTGFTLQNGMEVNGAGVYCENDDVLNDCVITNNSSPADGSGGGGANGGILNRCVLVGNSASYLGAGAAGATLNFCVLSNNTRPAYGGAACYCTLNNCLVVSNAAAWGGGVDASTMNNSLCIDNWANYGGGGAIWSTLNNCTVVNNMVLPGPGTYGGGGAFGVNLNNCIIYYNTASSDANCSGSALNYCCTTPDPGGVNDITNEPAFVNWTNNDFHLQSNSPCINSGNNAYVTVTNDLDGNPRTVGGTVDIGAYEYQTPTSIISYAWLQQYGLPTDGSADYADLDRTGMKNWQKWIAGLNPTNPASVLVMLTPVSTNNPPGLALSWQSVNTRTYYLQSSTNLTVQPAFSTIQSNIVGQAGTTTYTDTTATNGGSYFYRVGVQ